MEGQHQQQHDPGSASRGGSSVRDKGKGRMRNIQQSEITPDVALLREIDAKKQQIVQGFPLASMTGVSDVVSHLSILPAVPYSNFPSISGGTSTFAKDPLFSQYAREMDILMGSSKRPLDATISKQDFENLKASATSTVGRAMLEHNKDMDGLWKDCPYPLPSSSKLRNPYQPTNSKALKRADPTMFTSVANEILNKHNYPYPSPSSSTDATLGPLPPLMFNASNPPTKKTLTAGQKKRIHVSQSFLNNFAQDSQKSDSPDVKKARSPIPLLPSASPVKPVTTAKASTSSVPNASHSASRLSVPLPASPLKHLQANFPSPTSLVTSSPDPMGIIAPAYRPKQSLHKPSRSTSHIVVEVPVVSKKRYSSEDSNPAVPAKRIARTGSDGKPIKAFPKGKTSSKHGPFSDLTSEMEEQEEDGMDEDGPTVASSSPAVSGKTIHSSNTTIRIKPFGSGKKVAKVVSGEKEAEALLNKLTDLLEEIFQADDSSLDEDDGSDDQEGVPAPKYFVSTGNTDSPQRLLQPAVMRKLVKAIQALIKVPGGRKAMEEQVEAAHISRLLKTISRSIIRAENLQIIAPENTKGRAVSASTTPKKAAKGGKKGGKKAANESPMVVAGRRRSSRSATPASYDEKEDEEEDELASDEEEEYEGSQSSPVKPDGSKRGRKSSTVPKGRKGKGKSAAGEQSDSQIHWSWSAIEELESNLEILQNAVLAIETCMTILTSGRLSKQIYSEDLINSCLNTLKHNYAAVVYPALDSHNSPLSVPLANPVISDAITDLLRSAAIILPKIAALIKQEEMPETIIINAVYVAVAPFFAEQGVKAKIKGDGLGIAEMKLIRIQALVLVRTIFARYTEQRQWIIEEVLGSITKLPDLAKRKPQYLLQNGQAVQTVSVLLLHLVQSCTSGVREKMAVELRDNAQEAEKDDEGAAHIVSAQKIVEPAFGAATRCGTAIIGYLIQRSGKAPKNSTASEAEYKAVLDHLVKDLLVVVDNPEWPVATLLLQIAMKAMMGVLDDPKVSADVNTSKGICLELLGCVGARIHQLNQAAQPNEGEEDAKAAMSISQAVRNQDRKGLKQLASAEENMTQLLLNLSSDDGAMETAADYASARWSVDLLQAVRILPNIQREEEVKPKFERELYKRHASLWESPQTSSGFQFSSNDQRATLHNAHRVLFTAHGLPPAMDALLNHILNACEGAVIAFRQKALKALGAIVEQDSSIFFQQNVRTAVEKRLMDSSPAVRDAALEMLGRYVVYNPDLAVQYLVRIGERITDSGLSVRKRVIKLLKSIYPAIEDHAYQIDICRRLVGRVNDEDDGVKELAATAVEDLWFSSKPPAGKKASSGDRETSPAKKREILAKSSVMMAVAGLYRERPSPLEEMVKMIIDKYTNAKTTKSKESLAALTSSLRDIVEALVDALIDSAEDREFNVVNCIKTIYILLLADASMLSVSRASLLLPYLRGASTPEEQAIAEYLLKIFTAVLPHMPPSANKFANDLQETLRSLLNKPAAIGSQALPDLVACFCAVVVNQTYLYNKLCDVFKACYTRLQQGVRRLVDQERPLAPEEKAQLLRNMPILARMVSLFCQYADFDRLRASSPDARPYVDSISKDSIRDEVYFQMIQVYQLSSGTSLHGTALQCLGFLYRAHPRYMTEDSSTTIMDKIFTSGTAEARALLLRTICDFLVSQSAKMTDEDKDDEMDDVDMRQLVGNTENFADSGVSSAVVQRYQTYILEAAAEPTNPASVTRPALDIIAFTVKQGLAHPMQCLPVLVALETSEDVGVVQKVFSLHSLVHTKHSALVNTRIGESIEAAFRYQVKAKRSPQDTHGYQGDPPMAQLSRWYSLMREKRQWRLDFLKAFTRGLHTEAAGTACDQQSVNFARFTAENLATFDYKSQEEVLFVIRSTTILLSVTGMQIYHNLQDDNEEQANRQSMDDMPSLLKKSVILAFSFCLRNQLKALYGVTEQKLAKYTTGKKSAAGDKPAVAKNGTSRIMAYPNMPFVANEMVSEDDLEKQRIAYIQMIDSDGTIREAQNDEEDSE